MQKGEARAWIISLEEMVGKKLKKWDKQRKWENGEVIHIMWQWEHTIIKMDIFWEDKKETIKLLCVGPRENHEYIYHSLTTKSLRQLEDRIGNLAMLIFHPPIEPPE